MKTEVYSWRVSSELKSDLERAARARKVPVSKILDEAARNWLQYKNGHSDEEEQRRLHAIADQYIGSLQIGSGPYTNAKVRKIIRERLGRRYGRRPS